MYAFAGIPMPRMRPRVVPDPPPLSLSLDGCLSGSMQAWKAKFRIGPTRPSSPGRRSQYNAQETRRGYAGLQVRYTLSMRRFRLFVGLLMAIIALAGWALAQTPTDSPAKFPTDSMYGWLGGYAGRRARDVAQDPLFSPMLQLSVPNYQGVVMGRDSTLTSILETQMFNSTRRVEMRDRRYLDFRGYRADGGVSQSFFWVDLAQDQALGALYVCLGPVGGCDQQLWIFAQRTSPVANLAQLPPDFVSALAAWQAKARSGPPDCRIHDCRMPGVFTQYFIGARGRHLLLHAVGLCAAAGGNLARCRSVERDASELDLKAAWQRASGTRGIMDPIAAEQAQGAWLAQRNQQCGAPDAVPDCYSQRNEQRAAALLRQSPAFASPGAGSRPVLIGGPNMPRSPACRQRIPIYEPDPAYTYAARQARFQGSVQARITISADGHVGSVVITNPIGYGLDEVAEKTLDAWRFRPLPAACAQVDTTAEITLSFHLGP